MSEGLQMPTHNAPSQYLTGTSSGTTQAWLHDIQQLYAYNSLETPPDAQYTHADENATSETDGWVHGEWLHCAWALGWTDGLHGIISQDQLAEELNLPPFPPSPEDVHMRDPGDASDEESDVASTMHTSSMPTARARSVSTLHTSSMRTVGRGDNGDEGDDHSSLHTIIMQTVSGTCGGVGCEDDESSTVRNFFEETADTLEANIHEIDDRNSLFSATSSGSTTRPNRTRSPTIVTGRRPRDGDYDDGIDFSDQEVAALSEREIKLSDDEDEEAVKKLVLSGVEEAELEEGEIPEEADLINETPPSPAHYSITRSWTSRMGGMSLNPYRR